MRLKNKQANVDDYFRHDLKATQTSPDATHVKLTKAVEDKKVANKDLAVITAKLKDMMTEADEIRIKNKKYEESLIVKTDLAALIVASKQQFRKQILKLEGDNKRLLKQIPCNKVGCKGIDCSYQHTEDRERKEKTVHLCRHFLRRKRSTSVPGPSRLLSTASTDVLGTKNLRKKIWQYNTPEGFHKFEVMTDNIFARMLEMIEKNDGSDVTIDAIEKAIEKIKFKCFKVKTFSNARLEEYSFAGVWSRRLEELEKLHEDPEKERDVDI